MTKSNQNDQSGQTIDELSPEETRLDEEMRKIYNSGNCRLAAEMSVDCLKAYPQSRVARYNHAVYHGDLSYEPGVGAEEREKLLATAKSGFSSLLTDPKFSTWPLQFQSRVRNEYYWFFQQHQQQYELGLEILARGSNGHYSACVGASMLGLVGLKHGDLKTAEKWARVSLEHFREFEKLAPTWYNINHFGAQAHLCLGQWDEAQACFRDMFRKQGTQDQDHSAEIQAFQKKFDELKVLRLRIQNP